MLNYKVYIIVLNYNNYQDTIECLTSLLQLDYKNYQIVLVDNASTDDSDEIFQAYLKRQHNSNIYYIRSLKNGGYAAGNNIGIQYAMAQEDLDYVWVLNNDTTVDRNSLTELVKKVESDKEIGLCGSKLVYAWDKTKIQGYGGNYNQWLGTSNEIKVEAQKIDFVIGASVFISKEFLEEIGLMCEDYFLYYEEIDWAIRAKGKYKLACAEASIVYHKEGATTGASNAGKNKKSELADYYSIRNRILVTKKYFPYCLPTVYLGLIWTIINRFRRHQAERVPMILKLMLGIGTDRYENLCR